MRYIGPPPVVGDNTRFKLWSFYLPPSLVGRSAIVGCHKSLMVNVDVGTLFVIFIQYLSLFLHRNACRL